MTIIALEGVDKHRIILSFIILMVGHIKKNNLFPLLTYFIKSYLLRMKIHLWLVNCNNNL